MLAASFLPPGEGATPAGTGDQASSGLGDLCQGEVKQIQQVVDTVGRPLTVVGSAARGGRVPGSDIDYTTASAWVPYFQAASKELPGIGLGHAILEGAHEPYEGPGIRFEPGVPPVLIPKKP